MQMLRVALDAAPHNLTAAEQRADAYVDYSRGGSPGYRAWVEGMIAESAERLGDWPGVEAHYLNALKLQPQDNFLLVAYADFLLDRGRPQEVLPLLADHAQSDTAFLRLALAQSLLHSDQAQRYTWIMAARFEALRLRGSEYFLRHFGDASRRGRCDGRPLAAKLHGRIEAPEIASRWAAMGHYDHNQVFRHLDARFPQRTRVHSIDADTMLR
jgi:predicted Zn-dependent protease